MSDVIRDPIVVHGHTASRLLEFIETTALVGCVDTSYDFHQPPEHYQLTAWLARPVEVLSHGERLLWQVALWLADMGELPSHYDMRERLDRPNYARVTDVVAAQMGGDR